MSGTPIYRAWITMKQRCTNPKSRGWRYYGGRGIKLCLRWHKFENFLKDMGKRPSSRHSVERKNNDGDYCPENCVWLRREFQNRNTRRNRWVTLKGETRYITDWQRKFGVSTTTLYRRLRYGWSIERALTQSPDSRRQRKTSRALTGPEIKRSIRNFRRPGGLSKRQKELLRLQDLLEE